MYLQDGFKPASTWVGNGIAWLDDIQAFYRERSVIEKDYSAKLAALAKKYFEKKSKKSASLSVGDSPTMTPGSLERCASMAAYSTTPEAHSHIVLPSRLGVPSSARWRRAPTSTRNTATN
jgi:hypothetical protein